MDKGRGTCEGSGGERNRLRLYIQGHDIYNWAENAAEEMERKDEENIVYTSIIKRVNGEEMQRARRK